MFFLASKLLGFFTVPSNVILILAGAGVLLAATRFASFGRRLTVVAVLLLATAGLSPLGNALILPLEQRFPTRARITAPPDGIIVLGGAISVVLSAARGEPALNETAERVTVTAELARRFPSARIVYSGGNPSLLEDVPGEATVALSLFERLGISRERIEVEDRSLNTEQNAIYTKELVRPKVGERWLLVTSAFHMPRSVGLFRKAGFAVEPYPVDWRVGGSDDLMALSNVAVEGLGRTDAAMREWMGLIAYRATGKIDELLPGPAVK